MVTWPPATHDDVSAQAYATGGGDYFRSGFYAHGSFANGAWSTESAALNKAQGRPFLVPVRRGFDRIGINVTTATATGLIRLGIYSPGAGLPGSLYLDCGTVSATTTGAKEATISTTLDPGVWWLVYVLEVGSGVALATYPTSTTSAWVSMSTSPPATVASDTGGMFFNTTLTAGSMPTNLTNPLAERAPVIMLRAA